jgi:hypothetical protein
MAFSQLMALASLYPMLLMAGLLFILITGFPATDRWSYLLAASPFALIPLLLSIAAWYAFSRRQFRGAALLSGLSFAVPLGMLLLLWIYSYFFNVPLY